LQTEDAIEKLRKNGPPPDYYDAFRDDPDQPVMLVSGPAPLPVSERGLMAPDPADMTNEDIFPESVKFVLRAIRRG
jgi:hypothetical protein